jgi:hypothetical protein
VIGAILGGGGTLPALEVLFGAAPAEPPSLKTVQRWHREQRWLVTAPPA